MIMILLARKVERNDKILKNVYIYWAILNVCWVKHKFLSQLLMNQNKVVLKIDEWEKNLKTI